MAARVMVFAKINRGDEEAFEAAYAQVTANVKGTPGHIADELLRRNEPPDGESEPRTYVLLSEWESKEAFLAWENAPAHTEPGGEGAMAITMWDSEENMESSAAIARAMIGELKGILKAPPQTRHYEVMFNVQPEGE